MIVSKKIDEVTFENDLMFLHFLGESVKINLELVSSKLLAADEIQRNFYKISPSGYGIHWPLIDEDLSIEKLLKASI